MEFNLFFILPAGKYDFTKTTKPAIHFGSYASKDEALAHWDKICTKLPLTWQPVLAQSSSETSSIIFDREKATEILPSLAPQLIAAFPKLPLAFNNPFTETVFEGTPEGVSEWLQYFNREWGNTSAPANEPEVQAEAVTPLAAVATSEVVRLAPKGHC
jgi:hypothetical protein